MSQTRFFFVNKRDDRLEKLGCKLTILQMLIPWEIFRKKLECLYKNSPKGGRPPYDCVMMLKILILQSLYNLSDDETEYQVTDRLSFQKFLGDRTGRSCFANSINTWKNRGLRLAAGR